MKKDIKALFRKRWPPITKKDEDVPTYDLEEIQGLEKAPCLDCGSMLWEEAYLNDDNTFSKCNLCHYYDEQLKELKPILHS